MPTAYATIVTRPSPGSAVTLFGYDAEYHIGLVPWDDTLSARTTNTTLLTAALQEMWYGGNFAFANGDPGPLLYPIIFPGSTYYFLPPVLTGTRIGGAIFGTCGGGYEMLKPQYTIEGGAGGMRTRLIGINEGSDTEPVLRIRGSGFGVYGMDIYGREMYDWSSNGSKAVACIQMEGGASRNPGRAIIQDCGLFEATYGIQTLAGYYNDSNVFVEDENHADLSTVTNVEFFNVDSCFRSENQQSIGWNFRQIFLEPVGNNPVERSTVFDIVRGGCLSATGVIINHGAATVLRIKDYSPHQASFDIRDIYRDRSPVINLDDYFTLVKHDGTGTYPWRVRISGACGDTDPNRFDKTRYLDINASNSIDTSNMYFDIFNLNMDEFNTAGEGPYFTQDPTKGPLRTEIITTSAYYPFNEMTGSTTNARLDVGQNGTLNGSTNWSTKSISYAEWSGYVATFTTSTNHPYRVGRAITVSGVTSSNSPSVTYNGTFIITGVSSNTFTVSMGSDPGSYTSGGTTSYGAIKFTNSSSDYVNIPDDTSNSLYTSSTIAFWVYVNSWTDGCVISKTGATPCGFRTEVSANHFYITEGGQNKVDFVSSGLTTGAWYHIALTLDSSGTPVYKAYMNGSQVSTGTMSGGSWLSWSLPLRLGAPSSAFYDSGSAASDVFLDDVRCYKRVLSAAAVAELYDMES